MGGDADRMMAKIETGERLESPDEIERRHSARRAVWIGIPILHASHEPNSFVAVAIAEQTDSCA